MVVGTLPLVQKAKPVDAVHSGIVLYGGSLVACQPWLSALIHNNTLVYMSIL